MGTPLERTSPIKDSDSIKAKGYGMVGDRFEGHDVARDVQNDRWPWSAHGAGEGSDLHRDSRHIDFAGHSMSDPAKYRSREPS